MVSPATAKPDMSKMHIPEAMVPLWTGGYEHYALYGGRGGAKSHGIAEPIVHRTFNRKRTVVCGREFQNSIDNSVKSLIEQKINKMGMSVYYKVTDRSIEHVGNGSKFSFIGMARNPESAKSFEGCDVFWGEEAQTFSKHSVELIIPTIRAEGSELFWSWNPRDEDDEVDQLFRGIEPPENSYIACVGWEDNPWFYKTRMPSERRRMLRVSPKRYAHIWGGGYDEDPDTSVFQNWSVGAMEIPPKAIPRFGLDFGFATDPNFIVKLYVIEELDTIYFAQEAQAHKLGNNKLFDFITQITEAEDYEIIADSARPETIDYLVGKGLNIVGARKGAGSVKNGLNWMQGYHLRIHPDCVHMQEEVRKYKWHVDSKGRPMPMPAPYQNDHGIDASRYAIEDLSVYGEDNDDDDGVDRL